MDLRLELTCSGQQSETKVPDDPADIREQLERYWTRILDSLKARLEGNKEPGETEPRRGEPKP